MAVLTPIPAAGYNGIVGGMVEFEVSCLQLLAIGSLTVPGAEHPGEHQDRQEGHRVRFSFS
jgi:hypothetical protein